MIDPLEHVSTPPEIGFRHDALLYYGREEFVDRLGRFIRDSIESDEPVMVMVTADKIADLKADLGADADRARFLDMGIIGRNPSRIIPAWLDFFKEAGGPGRRLRGIGEPIWPARTPEELAESQRHERLINIAFDGVNGWLVCPYDMSALDEDVIIEAHRSHPFISNADDKKVTSGLWDVAAIAPFEGALEAAPADATEIPIEAGSLERVRRAVFEEGSRFGLPYDESMELVIASGEVATNTLRHAGGTGTLRMWSEQDQLVLEIRSRGRITDPLVGRRRPIPEMESGFGFWLVNQLCDLVQIRSTADETTVRILKSRSA